MEQGVVLNGRERQLQKLSDEKRSLTATTASLRLKMRHARHGHVVREVERIIPILIPIERARAEAERAILLAILVDPFNPPREFLATREESTVMVQVVNVDLEPATTDLFEEPGRDRIALLRHDLEGRLDPQ